MAAKIDDGRRRESLEKEQGIMDSDGDGYSDSLEEFEGDVMVEEEVDDCGGSGCSRTSLAENNKNVEEEFVEIDPTGRYLRYGEIVGRGAEKTVYRAYDKVDCREVAWNKKRIRPSSVNGGDLDGGDGEDQVASALREIQVLRKVNGHRGTVRLFASWVNAEEGSVNFVTELCSSTLLAHRAKHGQVSRRAVRQWSTQILAALAHLHSQNPPIVHRDLKCDNILVKSSSGTALKIADFGCAAFLQDDAEDGGGDSPGAVVDGRIDGEIRHRRRRRLRLPVGTPAYMAPEMFEEDYDELIDVYAFGMCLTELITGAQPYGECRSFAEIYDNVIRNVEPRSLRRIKDTQIAALIRRCLLPKSLRPSAADLLRSDPFLLQLPEATAAAAATSPFKPNLKKSLSMPAFASGAGANRGNPSIQLRGRNESSSRFSAEAAAGVERKLQSGIGIDAAMMLRAAPEVINGCSESIGIQMASNAAASGADRSGPASSAAVGGSGRRQMEGGRRKLERKASFRLFGKVVDENRLRLKLRVEWGEVKSISGSPPQHLTNPKREGDIVFEFDRRQDTPGGVAEEMVRELGYPVTAVHTIADLISAELADLQHHYSHRHHPPPHHLHLQSHHLELLPPNHNPICRLPNVNLAAV